MKKAKILVVDDSAVMRRLLTDAIAGVPDLEISGTARNGQEAITCIESELPDLVLLDLEMPVLDGNGALRIISKRWPSLHVVVFSSFTAEGSAASIQALSLGASECLLKPRTGNAAQALVDVRQRLIPVVHALVRRRAPRTSFRAPTPATARPSGGTIAALVIASSTGGPVALETMLGHLGRVNVPVLIVQHMPPMFTAQLARRLTTQTGLDVAEAADGEKVQPGVVRMAPGGLHLEVKRVGAWVTCHLAATPPVHHVRPAADPLFATAATAYRGSVLGVVLTGMGVDGAAGARAVVEAGGEVFAQDEASSVVWGMPGAVVNAGLASQILPLERMGASVRKRLGAMRQDSRTVSTGNPARR